MPRAADDRRVALVTGATSGIGAEIARRLVGDGWHVVVHGRSAERGTALVAELAPHATLVVADLRDDGAADEIVAEVLAERGRLDALVSNAAVDHAAPLLDVPAADVRATFATNALAAIAMLQAAGRAMRDAGRGGSIVQITSRLASIGVPTMGIYSATKGALQSLTTAAAVELAPHGIRVNAVAPGMTRTPLYDEWVARQSDPAATEHRVAAAIPLGRIATPADVAAAVAYLVRDDAAYVTGVTIPVDGGYLAQ
ncbi:SDR family NAD(P)-dependent oxidoreductase [Agrococcus sp. SGAir0287]|uniref:SDR family NAD(P)-dependent oxidoreductase n=1 Tax=Agrococcus sp. SGAir0287 TaxID=2070347 RepID=UPI0010CCCCBA|nr:SDR family oxidoreductase [Agrococcus sp. SGAir0287]QCR18165.1 dehydrogenase [Agrococcus sp. SGAir0287]